MARASFDDLKPLADSVLTQNDFLLNLGVVPGSGLTQSREALLKCISISLPHIDIEPLMVDVHGFKVMHRGIKKFGDQIFSCEFLVSGDTTLTGYNADSYNLIYNWLNFLADTDNGSSQPGKSLFFSGIQGATAGASGKALKALGLNLNKTAIDNSKLAYALDDVALNIYNTAGNLTIKVSLDGVFPVSLEGLEFNSSSMDKQVLKIRATFAFDSYTISDILTTKALQAANALKDRLVKKLGPKVPSAVKKFSRIL